MLDRHLHYLPGLGMDRQDRRVGRTPLRPECWQHDGEDFVEAGEHAQQRRVEPAGSVVFGRGCELVLEAELVEEAAEVGVVVRAKTLVGAERVGDRGQRLAQVAREQIAVRHVVGNLPQPVHVVAERDQARGAAGQRRVGMAHPGGPGDLAEGADMRQAGGAVAGLEHGDILGRSVDPRCQLGRFLERPGARQRRRLRCLGHGAQARQRG